MRVLSRLTPADGDTAENYDVNRHGYGSMIVVENDDDGSSENYPGSYCV